MAGAEQNRAEPIKHETFEEHIKQIQYDADTFDGQAFQDKFLSENTLKEHNSVVIALMKTEEIEYLVEEILARREGVYIEDRGVYYYIEGDGQITIDFDEVEEGLGRSYTVYDFLVNLSTTVGRAMTLGNKFVITTRLAGIEVDVDEIGEEEGGK
ncbi:MAG TPA: MmoB/DmpM family protein [Methylomirabilota bacterium]|jgi:methane monooxygenase regulatory protein B|nr:MmoB/DmpM family protein [Methylomirabilota bacterium]